MAIVYNETEREQILTGKINAFLRSWPTDVPELPEGSVQTLHVSEKNGPFAVVRIRTTRRLKLTDLTETMARQLGNRSRDEAIKDLFRRGGLS